MADGEAGLRIAPGDVRDPEVGRLLDALTAELATGGYTAEQTFGYSVDRLQQGDVHLLVAWSSGRAVGVGGVELQHDGLAELKRFFVAPEQRGHGVADAILAGLSAYAATHGARVLRLETGDRQHPALAFYRRHGFVEVPRFAPYESSATSVCMQRALV